MSVRRLRGRLRAFRREWRLPRSFLAKWSAALLAVHLYDELDRSVRHGPWRNDGSTGL